MSTCADISEALGRVTKLLQSAKAAGIDNLGQQLGAHLNPGDVFDAYEALQYTPVTNDTLEGTSCGPFVAVYLYSRAQPDAATGAPSVLTQSTCEVIAECENYVSTTFDDVYVEGFRDGFQLEVPDSIDGQDARYIRGVYDGTMAHAAVF